VAAEAEAVGCGNGPWFGVWRLAGGGGVPMAMVDVDGR